MKNWQPTIGHTSREAEGYSYLKRMERNGEVYGYVDPDVLASLAEPPPHAQAAMEDVLGEWIRDDDGTERVKLRVHPHMHRWCLYEREFAPEKGESVWRCFYIFQGDPIEGVLPLDMRDDPYKAHYTGKVGEYVEPTRDHFEMIERLNVVKYGHDTVNQRVGEYERRVHAEAQAAMEELEADFVDRNWAIARDEENQRAGSGQFMFSGHCDTWAPKSNVSRWRTEQKNGYSIKTRKSAEEYYQECSEEIRRFSIAWDEARGLRRNFKPSREELAAILASAGIIPQPDNAANLRALGAAKVAQVQEAFVERADSDEERTERKSFLSSLRLEKVAK